MFLPSAKVKPFGTLIVSRLGPRRGGKGRRKERKREREETHVRYGGEVRKGEGERKKRFEIADDRRTMKTHLVWIPERLAPYRFGRARRWL